MRFMIGLDVAGLSAGAVELGRWMAQRSDKNTFLGVHVVEHVEIQPPFTRNVDDHLARALGPVQDETYFDDIGSVPATAAEDGLIVAAAEKACDALILGRRSSDPKAIVRLGRVARHLLRRLPKPIIVAPPDLEARAMKDGPVLLGTDLGAASNGAAKFAPRLAQGLDLDLLVTHVSRVPGSVRTLVPSEQWSTIVGQSETSAREKFGPWIAEHGLSDARNSLVHGSPAGKLLEVAQTAGASFLVLGSRGLDTFDRIFLSSLASELAASAGIPVAVIPNDWS